MIYRKPFGPPAPAIFFMADDWIGIDEPATIDKRVDTESVVFGTTTVMRERMQIAGVSSGAVAPVSSATGLSVVATTASTINVLISTLSTINANLTTASSVAVSFSTASTVSVVFSTATTGRVEIAAGSTMTVSLTAASTIGVVLTTASTMNVQLSANATTISQLYDVNSSVGTVENIQGVSIRLSGANGSSEAGTTASPLAVLLQGSTATVTVQGNSTVSLVAASTLTASLTAGSTIGVVLTTASKSQVEFTTASTVSIVQTTATTGRVEIAAGSTMTVSLTAASTIGVILTSASITTASSVGVSFTTASTVSVIQNQSVIYQGTTAITPSYASISFATSGAQTIVSSVLNSVVRVLQWNLVCASTDSLQWRSGTSALTGLMPFAANGGISVPFSPVGLFQGTSGSPLNLFSETATSVGGSIVYLQSTAF